MRSERAPYKGAIHLDDWKEAVKLDVFLSWSGSVSHKVALAPNEWLPSVIQSVNPYISSQFQAVVDSKKEDVGKMVESINSKVEEGVRLPR